MNQPIYNDDVERIVNPRTAVARRNAQRKVNKLLRLIATMLSACLAVLVLWLLKVNSGIVTVMLTELLSVVAAFAAGRLWEVTRK